MNLNERIVAALGESDDGSPWSELMRLFEADREVFYALASYGAGPGANPRIQQLASLAGDVRSAITQSYELVPQDGGANITTYRGKKTFVPSELVNHVTEFLRAIDGKTSRGGPGRDFIGDALSEAEATFKLGDSAERKANRDELIAMRSGKPFVLRLDNEEVRHLASQPPYIVHELVHCARRTVLNPTAVYRGLKRGGAAPAGVNDGWAFCGKPRERYRNDGTAIRASERMVYVVYADVQGFIFDWDWVLEDPGSPGHPANCDLRFEEPNALQGEARLELPRDLQPGHFDPDQAWYSSRGDCLFWYFTGDESFASRINSDLTLFQDFATGAYTGLKIKNVRRILQVDRSILLADAPGLAVSVDSAFVATLKLNPDEKVQIYTAVIRAWQKAVSQPPKVDLPPPVAALVGA